jgi:hypothetical protein
MTLVGSEQLAERRLFSRRGVVICCAVLALIISLANRTVHGTFHLKPTVHSVSVNAKIQKQDKDAAEWAPEPATVSLLWISEQTVCHPSAGTKHLQPHYDSLYNRPPPLA